MTKRIYILCLLLMAMTTGTQVMAAEAYAVYTTKIVWYEDNILTFYYDDLKSTRQGTVFALNTDDNDPEWNKIEYYAGQGAQFKYPYTKAIFDPSFADARPTTTHAWFSAGGYENNLTEIEGIQYLNTSQVTNMSGMFELCRYLKNLDVSGFNTSKVTNMACMFDDCEKIYSLDLSGWDTSNVTNMYSMFCRCEYLRSLDLSGWNTSKVTDMDLMFCWCERLSSIEGISGWNTGNVTDMNAMFEGCESMESIDVSGWNTSKVTDMNSMFRKCKFEDINLRGWNTSKVTNMKEMFYDNSYVTTIYCGNGWSTSSVETSADMFYNCKKLVGGKGTTYNSSYVSSSYAHNDGGSSNPGYLTLLPYGSIPVDKQHFPDEAFRRLIKNEYGTVLDSNEISSTNELSVESDVIKSVEGIEYFDALVEFYVSSNQLTTADFSQNRLLKEIDIQGNFINGEGMDNLVQKLPQVTNAKILIYDGENDDEANEMTPEQVAVANRKGWIVQVYDENIRKWSNTEGFWLIDETRFPDANFRSHLLSYGFRCTGALTVEDVNDTDELGVEDCGVSDLTGIEYFTNTTSLLIDYNLLKTADLSKNTKLDYIYMLGNRIRFEDMDAFVEHLPQTTQGTICLYDCNSDYTDYNEMTPEQVAVAQAKHWTVKVCDKNSNWVATDGFWRLFSTRFEDPNFRSALDEQGFRCHGAVTIEDVRETTLLSLWFKDIQWLTGVGYFTELTSIYCIDNRLHYADFSKNTKLKEIYIYYNQIRGTNMYNFIEHLPTVPERDGILLIKNYDLDQSEEGNEMTASQVAAANLKGWNILVISNHDYLAYLGCDATPTGISDSPLTPTYPSTSAPKEYWYTPDGKKLNGEPTEKGLYIHNGKKVIK